MIQVLNTTDEVRRAIRRTLSSRARRVAIVAYVGNGAEKYLPKSGGIKVYCWPQPGSTTATGVRSLQGTDAKVFFADRVHMKVYWASGGDAVITSANLSESALGVRGLREAGVMLPASKVDIERLLAGVTARPPSEEELERLAKAEKKHSGRRGQARHTAPTYPEWLRSNPRRSWKWGFFEEWQRHIETRARGRKEMHSDRVDEIVSGRRSQYQKEDWILSVRLTVNGILTTPDWVYVHGVVLVDRRDRVYDEQWPYQAFQALPPRSCPTPPFRIDAELMRAVRAASKEFGAAKTRRQVDGKSATQAFLRLLKKHYR